MKKYLSFIFAVSMFGCGNVIVDWSTSGTGGELGGAGGTSQTSSETTSSAGAGGTETTSSTSETTSSTTDTLSTITSTTTKTCEVGKFLCMEACCDAAPPTQCISNESGYCCPNDWICVPKG